VLCPGELITDEVWEYLDGLAREGRHIHGAGDGLKTISVVVE
jgi:arginine/lysine/ornithine decarboxylase